MHFQYEFYANLRNDPQELITTGKDNAISKLIATTATTTKIIVYINMSIGD